MGGAVSSGRDNNELIDNLMGGGYIRSRAVERVFRVLDRADYMTPNERDQAYKDLAWRSGALHLSAPCIYSEVMEALELRPGLSFLNLGSGTGYLSTLVGLIIGSGGISHGVEIHSGVVEYSNKRLSQFQENSVTLDEYDYCVPKYYMGNALCLAPLQTPYDRVYVGAGVLPKYENYFKQLIKVHGVLVMPLGDTLVQIHRVSETEWTSRQLLNVSFALLRSPTKEETAEPLKMDELIPPPLTVLSRAAIRRAMLGGVCRRHPELREPSARRTPAPRPRARRICIPLDPDTDEGLNNLHDMDAQDGGREMNALLSLVLSMGNNRVAGSLRLQDDARDQEELEVLIDEIDHGSDGEANRLSTTDSEQEDAAGGGGDGGVPRPSSTGAAVGDVSIDNAELRIVYGGRGPTMPAITASLTTGDGAVTDTSGSEEEAPRPAAGAADTPTPATPAGRLDVQPSAVGVRPDVATLNDGTSAQQQDGGTESRPSTSGKSPDRASPPASTSAPSSTPGKPESRAGPSSGSSDGPASGPGSGSGSGPPSGTGNGPAKKRGSGGGDGPCTRRRRRIRVPLSSSRRRANQSANRAKRYPPAVQIYFGNAGVYDRSDVVHHHPEEAGVGARGGAGGARMDDDHSSSDDEPHTGAKDNKRQKLDSGIGEGAAFSSTSPSVSGGSPDKSDTKTDESDARSSTYTDASTTDNQESTSSGSMARHASGDGDGDDSGAGGGGGVVVGETRATRRARRHSRDARRVRLSIVMKRAVKELPLPHALKKYVNLGRCFQF